MSRHKHKLLPALPKRFCALHRAILVIGCILSAPMLVLYFFAGLDWNGGYLDDLQAVTLLPALVGVPALFLGVCRCIAYPHYLRPRKDSVQLLNAFGIVMKKVQSSAIVSIRVANTDYDIRQQHGVRITVHDRFLVLMLSKDVRPKGHLDIYNRKSCVSNEAIYLPYTPEALEILKQHLDVPVIVEDEKK